MKINRNNYEAFLLDQLEGSLSAEAQQQLRDFLALNPDCKGGIEEEDLWILSPETVHFPEKETLRKEIPKAGQSLTESHFDLFSIARMEGDLSVSQVREHEKMLLENPRLQQEWEEWQRTRLPGVSLLYPWKSQLKKPDGRGKRISWFALLSAAAAVALVMVLLTLRTGPSEHYGQDFLIQVPEIEQEHQVSPMVPAPLQKARQTLVPAPSGDQNSESDGPYRDMQQENRPTLMQPGKEGNMIALKEKDGTEWNASRLKTSEEFEIIPANGSLSGRLAQISPSAPVQAGKRDSIRPLYLLPSPINRRILAMTPLEEIDLQEVVEDFAEKTDLSLWTIASAGIRGINRITGSDLELYAARDDEGEISGIQFKSKRLNITTPLQKPE